MSGELLRFLHASNFHLEQPVGGLLEPPAHLRELLIDAPLKAAELVFDTAVLEQVDFLILSGDLLDPQLAEPRIYGFLTEQFEKLEEQDISIYWAGGAADSPDQWPENVALPSSVHMFSPQMVEELSHFRGERPVATIVGQSGGRELRPHDFRVGGGPFTIAVANGALASDSLEGQSIAYWALGGQATRATVASSATTTAHYPGSPQSRSPKQEGPHGCTLVTVGEDRRPQLKQIPCDVMRWCGDRVSVNRDATVEDLQTELQQMLQMYSMEAGERPVLASLTIQCEGKLAAKLRSEGLAEDVADWLRRKCGHANPPAWVAEILTEPPLHLPATWYEEDTILGDFLRAVRRQQLGEDAALNLTSIMADSEEEGALIECAELTEVVNPEQILREAALLGADLLGGGED